MSLNLNCPNCGRNVGEVENGEEKYYYANKNNEPTCPTCGDYSTFYPFKVVGFFLLIGLAIGVILNFCF